ncbi:thymus-specific serine protease [Eublepharis macularius]|uniref:Thymus-specific serine protease n=1 Tax=Eublepharis macularius TaxID=481883 RepID=A0AA97KG42_EUBMA|nr:thymus-specific serine protease [Eublepharis macularius]
MGALKLSLGLLFLLLALAQAGKNFQLFRQYILKQQEERAIKEISHRLRLLVQASAPTTWIPPIESTIRQPLDHFNRQNPFTFNQRFWINEEFWRHPDGPVFLYIGGESALSMFSVLSGHHVEMAEKYGALLVALEHRFYGASLNPDGLEDHNLFYLSSQQGLSDLVSFRLFITQKYNLTVNNTWICFGGSYPGSLAAWFRLKFPHLVFAAVSSSAPVRAQLDFKGYNKVVAESLLNPVVGGSRKCHEAVAEAFSTVDSLIHAKQMEKLAKDFHSCAALTEASDLVELVGNLASVFMGAVQYNDKGVVWGSVAGLCRIMTNSTGSPYQRLMVVNNMFLESMKEPCLENSHKKMLEELRSTNLSTSGVGIRQWFFQTCNEFGYYQTCEDSTCLFSRLITLQSLVDICSKVFNISLNQLPEAVAFTNEYYGADLPKASRVLFVNGDIDPWHVLSVLKNQSRSESALLINGTSHCADMRSSCPTDPLPLVRARKRINAQVGEWLELAQKITGGS